MKNKLTARQFQIVEIYLWAGSSKNAANSLGISHHTVDNTLNEARAKLGISREELHATYMEKHLGAKPPKYRTITEAELARSLRQQITAVMLLLIVSIGQLYDSGSNIYNSRTQVRRSSRSCSRTSRNRNEFDLNPYLNC